MQWVGKIAGSILHIVLGGQSSTHQAVRFFLIKIDSENDLTYMTHIVSWRAATFKQSRESAVKLANYVLVMLP